MQQRKILYRATVISHGGRHGRIRSSDGVLDVALVDPVSASPGQGSNPEQLFAAAWSACFLTTLRQIAAQLSLVLPDAAQVAATIGLGSQSERWALEADLRITLPGIERYRALELMELAHSVCPYSCATRHNIEVRLHLLV